MTRPLLALALLALACRKEAPARPRPVAATRRQWTSASATRGPNAGEAARPPRAPAETRAQRTAPAPPTG